MAKEMWRPFNHICFIIILLFAWEYCTHEKDSTDPVDGHSGLVILVDAKTGHEYLSTAKGGLTPRLK